MFSVFYNQVKKDWPVSPGCKSQRKDYKLYKVRRGELWELKQQSNRGWGNSGTEGSFSTAMSGHDTFFSRQQLPNTRERQHTWVNRKLQTVKASKYRLWAGLTHSHTHTEWPGPSWSKDSIFANTNLFFLFFCFLFFSKLQPESSKE